MKLTLTKIKTLPIGKKLSDGQGLCLTKTAPDRGRWEMRYMIKRRARVISLGPYPDISLSNARQKLLTYRALIAEGRDPLDERQRHAHHIARQNLRFSDMAHRCIAARKGQWTNAKHAHDWLSSLKRHAFPLLDQKPLAHLTQQDVIAVLNPLFATKRQTARKVQGRIKIVFAYAKIEESYKRENPALWHDQLEHYYFGKYKPHLIRHFRSLHHKHMPSFFTRLSAIPTHTSAALQYTILTASRTTEVRLATRDEFNLDKGVWTLPPHRMKTRRPHFVPLSEQALTLIETQHRGHNSVYVFPGRDQNNPLSNMAMLSLLKKQFPDIESTVHGFRSSFRVWAAEEVPNSYEFAEAALAHQNNRRVEGSYQRSSLMEPRRPLMQQWADYLIKSKTKRPLTLVR